MQPEKYIRWRAFVIVVSVVFFLVSGLLWYWLGVFAIAVVLPAALAVVLFGQLTFTKRQIADSRRSNAELVRQNQALHAIHKLLPLNAPLPAMAIDWAIDPVFAETIVSTVLRHNPKVVVELGSGTSTVVTAYALQRVGTGKVISIDDNEQFCGVTRDNIEQHRLTEFAEIHYAPLVATEIDGASYHWYDHSKLNVPSDIGLVIIDGPPGRTGRHARYPALPVLWSKLGEKVIVLLDDANRADEKEIVDRWLRQYPSLRCRYVNTRKGVAIIERADT